jgi:hypothetical protein
MYVIRLVATVAAATLVESEGAAALHITAAPTSRAWRSESHGLAADLLGRCRQTAFRRCTRRRGRCRDDSYSAGEIGADCLGVRGVELNETREGQEAVKGVVALEARQHNREISAGHRQAGGTCRLIQGAHRLVDSASELRSPGRTCSYE